MLKKFINGLVFGAGFSIAFVALWMLATFFVIPLYYDSHMSADAVTVAHFPSDGENGNATGFLAGTGPPFHSLSIDEQIAQSTAIALAKYEAASDGRMKAIIVEYLKVEPGTQTFYAVGDEFSGSSFYPKVDQSRGDGVVIFFAGSPATMMLSTSFYGDRITGLNDIPLELFRTKCDENAAQ